MIAWRASPSADLSGEEASRQPGRWHEPPRSAVYLALSPEGALLEALAQIGAGECPRQPALTFHRIEAPDSIDVRDARAMMSEADCRDEACSRRQGSAWLDAGDSALLIVPSSLMPRGRNAILNPRHPQARLVRVVESFEVPLDARLVPQG